MNGVPASKLISTILTFVRSITSVYEADKRWSNGSGQEWSVSERERQRTHGIAYGEIHVEDE